jgi:hypothetical protein
MTNHARFRSEIIFDDFAARSFHAARQPVAISSCAVRRISPPGTALVGLMTRETIYLSPTFSPGGSREVTDRRGEVR